MVSNQEDLTTPFEDISQQPLDKSLQKFKETRRRFLQQKS